VHLRSKLVLISIFVLSAVIGASLYFRGSSPLSLAGAVEIDWRMLGDLDYITGAATPELKMLDGKIVRIPGFMVPLEDNMKSVVEFLLVPSPQACIHVPPPPPNQMILVNMGKESHTEVAGGPIWVYGEFRLTTKKTIYGESSFELIGKKIEPYR
jgi:uncharacterized protein